MIPWYLGKGLGRPPVVCPTDASEGSAHCIAKESLLTQIGLLPGAKRKAILLRGSLAWVEDNCCISGIPRSVFSDNSFIFIISC